MFNNVNVMQAFFHELQNFIFYILFWELSSQKFTKQKMQDVNLVFSMFGLALPQLLFVTWINFTVIRPFIQFGESTRYNLYYPVPGPIKWSRCLVEYKGPEIQGLYDILLALAQKAVEFWFWWTGSTKGGPKYFKLEPSGVLLGKIIPVQFLGHPWKPGGITISKVGGDFCSFIVSVILHQLTSVHHKCT